MLEVILGLAMAAAASPVELAITIDDLPFNGSVGPGDTKAAATGRILEALKSHHAPVAGFVNCGRAASAEELHVLTALWVAAGAELGNHTQSHRSLNKLGLSDWLDDVRACHGRLTRELDRAPRFFRYPFLQEGRTPEMRDAAAAGIAKLGYRTAQVSVDTSDWALAVPYVDALGRGAQADAARIGRAYVQHVTDAALHYRDDARRHLGRDIRHVLLLHATAVAADWLGAALDRLAAEGFSFVDLPRALADPVYAMPEKYVGPIGLSWLYRIRANAALDWRWDDAQTDLLVQEYGRETPGLRTKSSPDGGDVPARH